MQSSLKQLLLSKESRWALVFLLFLSYFTVVHGFWNPASLFWDENYHIASAQKYLNGTFFMEPHPPLGKLMIALGEKITHMNATNDQFIGTDYATNPPPGFSFFGYRLFPVLLAWLTVPLIFGIFLLLTRQTLWATLLSFLYVFDNALMVHLRSAMLESTMLFFGALAVFGFLMAWYWKDDRKTFRNGAVLFGLGFAGVLATKAFGLIMILLVPAMVWLLWPNLQKALRFIGWGALSFAILYIGVWQIHFTLASKINPTLPDAGYYQASESYKSLLSTGRNRSLIFFPVMLRDSLKFVSHYQRGVPRLDLCKADENGSPWFFWPFGARTINYRWETPDGNSYRYLYLIPNPAVWAVSFAGVVLSIVLLLSSFFAPGENTKLRNGNLLLVFTGMYIAFMLAVSRIDRVMYLYHYFLPLFFSFILFALVFLELKQLGRWKLTDDRKTGILLGIAALIFLGFELMRPFTYYEPLNDTQFNRRNLLQIWDMKCVHCDRNSPLVVPRNS
jgi:dolichyl-phosphate-mannose-protein mannosyltransferase